jgi:hypothetical protein
MTAARPMRPPTALEVLAGNGQEFPAAISGRLLSVQVGRNLAGGLDRAAREGDRRSRRPRGPAAAAGLLARQPDRRAGSRMARAS